MDLVLSVLQDPHEDLGHLCGIAITDRLIVAAGGVSASATLVASSNARRFEQLRAPSNDGIRDVLVAGDSLWVCGEYGMLAVSRDAGDKWQKVATGTNGCLFGLALGSDGAVWVCGDGGYVARVLGPDVERVDFMTDARMTKIYALRDDIIALGFDGVIRTWRDDGRITTVMAGTTKALTAVTITQRNTWIVVGDGGFIARSPDGAWFSKVPSPAQVDLEGVVQLKDARLVAVGDRGCVLVSTDDGRTWLPMKHAVTSHLWCARRFGAGALIGGDEGMLLELGTGGQSAWHERPDVFAGARQLDAMFAGGPAGFIATGLSGFLELTRAAPDPAEDEGEGEGEEEQAEDDEEDQEDAGVSPGGEPAVDEDAFAALGRAGTFADFEAIYGVPLAPEARRFFELTAGADRWSTFDELRLDNDLRPDVGDANLFELMVRRNQQAYLGTDLVEAFCGVFGIGSQGNGDTYHAEIYEWDGPRQVLHFDHETASFTGVFADSLDSLAYLCALVKAGDARTISKDAYQSGLRALHGKVSPTWHFSIDEKDPEFVRLSPKRRDSEFFYYRARWICALLKNDGVTDLDDVPELFDTKINTIIASEQLAARFEACGKFIPTALYAMWRAFLFDEPELERYLEIGRGHAARLVRDAARLIDELRGGRNTLGSIEDVRGLLARFRALDLDPRRAEARKAEAADKAKKDQARRDEVTMELVRTPEAQWSELAWRWILDGTAHRALLTELDRRGDGAVQLAALEALRDMSEDEREIAIGRLATELSPVVEAILIGTLVRDDRMDDVLFRDVPDDGDEEQAVDADADDEDGEDEGENDDEDDEDDDDDGDDEDDEEKAPNGGQVTSALAMTERALRLAPEDSEIQFTHAMLLLDAERSGVVGKGTQLLAVLEKFAPRVRIGVANRLGAIGHARFRDAVDLALADDQHGVDVDVASDLYGELGEVVLEHAPDRMMRLVAKLPDEVELLCELAHKAIEAGQRDAAIALYDRMLAIGVPDEADARQIYLRALNNACIQAHAGKIFDAAVRIANRAQPVAHENPYIFHSAACAYAAAGDLARAFEQVKLAFDHEYDHVAKIEADSDLGALLEWPEFKALFRDWHARQEGN